MTSIGKAPRRYRKTNGPYTASPHLGNGFTITGIYEVEDYIYWGLGTVLVNEDEDLYWSIGPRVSADLSVEPDAGATLWRSIEGVPTPISSVSCIPVRPGAIFSSFIGEGRDEVSLMTFTTTAGPTPNVRWVPYLLSHIIFTPTVFTVGSVSVSGETLIAGTIGSHQVLTATDPAGTVTSTGVPPLVAVSQALDMPETITEFRTADVVALTASSALIVGIAIDETIDGNPPLLCIYPFNPLSPTFLTNPSQTPGYPVKYNILGLGIEFGSFNIRVTRRTNTEAVVVMDSGDSLAVIRLGSGGELLGVEFINNENLFHGFGDIDYMGSGGVFTNRGTSGAVNQVNDLIKRLDWTEIGSDFDPSGEGIPIRYNDGLYTFSQYVTEDILEIQNRSLANGNQETAWEMDLIEQPELRSIADLMNKPTFRRYGQISESCFVIERVVTGPTRIQIVQVCAGQRGISNYLEGNDRFVRLPQRLVT